MGNCISYPKNEPTFPLIQPIHMQAPYNTSAVPMVGPSKENIPIVAPPKENAKPQTSEQPNVAPKLRQIQHKPSVSKPAQPTSILHGSRVFRERNVQASEIVARVDPGSYVNGKVMDIQPTFDTINKI